MTRDHVAVLAALLVLAGLGGAAWQQARREEAAAAAELQEQRITALEAQVARLEEAQRPDPYVVPVSPAWVSSATGYRTDPMGGGEERLHDGLDLVGYEGQTVRAVRAGVVAEHWVPPDGERWRGHPVYGGMIVIDHGGGLFTRYGHLSETYVHEGDAVEMGQVIGAVGSTGMSTGAHLHLQVIVDPLRYLQGGMR